MKEKKKILLKNEKKVAVGTLCMLLLGFCLCVVDCERYEPRVIEEEPDTDTSCLAGTHWKLVGIFDAETDTLIKELEPDGEECYTLNFGTAKEAFFPSSKKHWTCTGKLVTITFLACYVADSELSTFSFTSFTRHATQQFYDGEMYGVFYDKNAFFSQILLSIS